MSKKITIAAILLLFFLAGCRQQEEITLFPASKPLSLSKDSVPAILAVPAGIVIHEGKVIILDMESDWHFKVFSLEGLEYLGSFLRKGRGPEEEIAVSPYFRGLGDGTILYQGVSSLSIAQVRKTQGELDFQIIKEYELPAEISFDTDFFLLNDKIFSTLQHRPFKKDFQGYCPSSGKLFEWGELMPLKSPHATETEIPILLSKLSTVKPDSKMVAVVYSCLPIIRFYCALSGRKIAEKHVADPSKNKDILLNPASDLVGDGLKTFYFNIKSTNEYIYALYSGQPSVKLQREGDRPIYKDAASEIHIWRWDGTPVKRLLLDRSIFSFDVTPDNQRIVAVSTVDVDYLFHAEIPWDKSLGLFNTP